MSAFSGRWRLVESDSLDPIHEAIGVPAHWRAKAALLTSVKETAPEEEFDLQGDKAVFRIYLNKKLIKQGSTKVGKVIDTTALDGRDIKLKLERVAENRLIRTETGDGYEVKYDRQVDGDEMTLTVTAGEVKCVRKYHRVKV